ncbi:MAG: hypothetical protein HGA28_08385 [Anaerolineaceae bacterium]|nr:hypothetical protein [Anaerolineaceae bacterium]
MIKTLLVGTGLLSLFLGAVGVGVAASRASNPNHPLDGLNTWAKGVQIQVQTELQNQIMEQNRINIRNDSTQDPVRLQTHIRETEELQLKEQDRLQIRTQEQKNQNDIGAQETIRTGYGANPGSNNSHSSNGGQNRGTTKP